MIKKLKEIGSVFGESYIQFIDDKGFKMAAALSYYTVFSMAPLLIIVIAIAGFVFGEDAARGQIVAQMQGLIGHDGSAFIENMIKGASAPTAGIFATIIGVVVLVLGSLGVFLELQESLNIIWGIEQRPGRGIWGIIKNRLLSFSMVVGTGFLLLVFLVVNAVISGLEKYLGDSFPASLPLIQVINVFISLAVVTVLFGLIYYVLPDLVLRWKYIWRGAVFTAILFSAGKFLIGLYLGSSSYTSTYGAAASLAILLIWIYYSGLLLYLGAEITQVYRMRYGKEPLKPDKDGIIIPKVSQLLKETINEEGTVSKKKLAEKIEQKEEERRRAG
ncbi:MAG: YihY/virulence factor BrkB family protein [Ignavibacteriae bacterium]|nr:MAG: YihY/virulence factor BrkB family protein [Ignavibacteriota bacterium]